MASTAVAKTLPKASLRGNETIASGSKCASIRSHACCGEIMISSGILRSVRSGPMVYFVGF